MKRLAIQQRWSAALFAAMLALAHLSLVDIASIATAQLPAPQLPPLAPVDAPVMTEPVAPAMPEPVYWKQDLFLIPYQFGSAAEPAAAQAVWLFVSKDRGTTWQKISEAKPQVRAFNYRADGEGEYWFAIRTLDHQGRTWPAGAYQPELRVIVDTTIPRIESLRAQLLTNGQIDIAWVCSDANLDSATLAIEAQVDTVGTWQSVPLANAMAEAVTPSALGPTMRGQVQWQPPPGTRPLAVRAMVADRAANSATYRAEVNLVAVNPMAIPPAVSVPAAIATTPYRANVPPYNVNASAAHSGGAYASGGNALFTPPTAPQVAPPAAGWVSSSTAASPPPTAFSQPAVPVTNQAWPANAVGQSPFRLSSSSTQAPSDGITTYGSPPVVTAPATPPATAAPPQEHGAGLGAGVERRMPAQYATTRHPTEGGVELAPRNGPRFAALDPFRHTLVKRLPMSPAAAAVPAAVPAQPVMTTEGSATQVKRVGSRTFALEYDLDDSGRWGVSKVELWGTRDGGKTWHSFGRDDDHRSPLVATVDQEGVYGFRIVVDIAGSAVSAPPSPGDEPELWVAVDLQRPSIELTAIERGQGNNSDHLTFRWQASDGNLEPRPISLFYSSRPTGPWSAIATGLEDTGEYTWRVERHVPARFFVRAEARDTAGNLAAFQTREPIDFAPQAGGGHLRSVEPIGPTARDSGAAIR